LKINHDQFQRTLVFIASHIDPAFDISVSQAPGWHSALFFHKEFREDGRFVGALGQTWSHCA
jgi:hypothetical protein